MTNDPIHQGVQCIWRPAFSNVRRLGIVLHTPRPDLATIATHDGDVQLVHTAELTPMRDSRHADVARAWQARHAIALGLHPFDPKASA